MDKKVIYVCIGIALLIAFAIYGGNPIRPILEVLIGAAVIVGLLLTVYSILSLIVGYIKGKVTENKKQ